jgi:hypothetical protein
MDNDSIFVVMSDQKPPAPGAEEVHRGSKCVNRHDIYMIFSH